MSPEIQAFTNAILIALGHAGLTLALLVTGAVLYALMTPHKEISLIRDGNAAAAVSFGGVLVALALPDGDTVHKVSIVARGIGSLGYTIQRPTEDRYLMTQAELQRKICVLLGGRAAEKLMLGHLSTGAADDLAKATQIAREMVMRYGMTQALGPMVYAENEGEVFLGRSVTKTTNMSESTMQKVDSEVRRIIDEQYNLARRLIEENSDKMHAMAKALLEWETIDVTQLDDIMAGREPQAPKDWTPRIPPSGNDDAGGTPAVKTDPEPNAA